MKLVVPLRNRLAPAVCFARSRRSLAVLPTAVIPMAIVHMGCFAASSRVENVRVSYRFDNVRSNDDFDEWEHIMAVISGHAVDHQVQDRPVTGSERTIGNMTVRQYMADFEVGVLAVVDDIHRALEKLATRKFDNNERIEFKQLRASADFAYASNYIQTGIEITMHGVTDPDASVNVFLHDGTSAQPQLENDGRWSMTLTVAPSRRYFYGYSFDEGTGVRKYFRIDIFTQLQQDVGAAEFERLRQKEP